MFRVAQVTGNGSFQTIASMDETKEGAIHSIVFNNTTGVKQVVTFGIGGVEFQYDITEKNTEVSNIKINIPVSTGVNVTAPSGVKVSVSYVEMAIDPASALSSAQSIAQSIFEVANQMRAELPTGTIFDDEARDDATWSSEKISTEISNVANSIRYYTANDENVGAMMYFTKVRFDGAFYGGDEYNPESTTRLNYDGNLHATTFIESSDRRIKTDLKVIDDAVEKIEKVNGYTFTMKESGERKTGLVAQEVKEVLPEAVFGNEDDGYSVAYGNMVGILVEAVKELSTRVKELEEK